MLQLATITFQQQVQLNIDCNHISQGQVRVHRCSNVFAKLKKRKKKKRISVANKHFEAVPIKKSRLQTNKQTKPDDITLVQTLLIAPICSQSHCELFQISAHSTKQELLSQAFDHQRSLVFTKNSHNNTIHAQLIFLKWMKIFCSVVKLQG